MKKYAKTLITTLILVISSQTFALVGLDETILDSTVTGKFRLYNFDRSFTHPDVPTTNSTAAGGDLSLLTGNFLFPGLQLGGSFYTSQPVFKPSNPLHVDRALPGFSDTPLGQLYAQYHYKLLLVRAGYQYITTPWMSAVDTRMIPALYQGYYATFGPWNDITFTALRMFRFKPRAGENFIRETLYNPPPEVYGGSPVPFLRDRKNAGALAFGSNYKKNAWDVQAWYYHYYDYGQMGYIDGKYTFAKWHYFTPFLGAQMVQEWPTGANILKTTHTQAFGALIGTNISALVLSAGFNVIPTQKDAFRGGDLVSPYTAGYDDPLYTTSMIAGLVEKAAGHAFKLSAALDLWDKKVQIKISRGQYYTAPFHPDTAESDLDITYNFFGKLKGLSLRNRIGILTGNPTLGRYIQNRVMLQYVF